MCGRSHNEISAHEVVLGGNALIDAPIDVVERGQRCVEAALARLWLFAALGFLTPPTIKRIIGFLSLLTDGAHYRMPRATVHMTITRIIAFGLSGQVASAARAP